MGLRYRKTFGLVPGVRVNVSKSGVSLSVGKKGVTTNLSRQGVKTTFGIPGSGVSYSTRRKGWLGLFGGAEGKRGSRGAEGVGSRAGKGLLFWIGVLISVGSVLLGLLKWGME